ncbi:hypothetical protein HDU80_011426, partial [Chytriomyces hyalinus]
RKSFPPAKHPMMDQFKFPKLRGIMSGAAPLGALNSFLQCQATWCDFIPVVRGINKEGELWVRGPKLYHNNPTATANSIGKEGWFHTGDIAVVDENILFYTIDPLEGIDQVQRPSTSRAELEAYLLKHPAVANAAVTGQPDEADSEVPRAYDVLKVGLEPMSC